MRFVAIALVLACFPLFFGLLNGSRSRRPLAFMALGFMLLLGDNLRVFAALVAWPLWSGTVKGLEFSLVDALSFALIMTRTTRPGRLSFWGLWLFYATTVILSVFPSFVPFASFFAVWQLGRVLLLFAAVGGESHDPVLRRNFLIGLALGLILQAGYVVQQKASGMVQATGTMFHQNTLGMMVEMALLPLIAALLGGERSKVIFAGVGAGMLVIAGGGSRGALAIAGGGATVLLLLSLMRGMTPAKAKVAGMAVLALVVAAPVSMWTLRDRFGNNAITVQDDQRPAFERAARAMANDNPLGVGANLYVPTANTKGYADKAGVAWNFANRSAPVHNAYLLARAETGWLGEISFILLLAIPLIAGLRLAFTRRGGLAGEIALGGAVSLGVNMVHNNFEFASLTYWVLAMIAVNTALIASAIKSAELSQKRVTKKQVHDTGRQVAATLA